MTKRERVAWIAGLCVGALAGIIAGAAGVVFILGMFGVRR